MAAATELITRADESDAEVIREIAIAANIDAWSVADYGIEINRAGSYVLKSVADDRVSGFLLARTVPGSGDHPDIDLYNIAVRAERFRTGVGSALLSGLRKQVASTRAENIWLEVRESNDAAIRFYEKHGFVAEVTRPRFYRDPVEDAVIMRLRLRVSNDLTPVTTMLDSRG